MVCSPAAGVNGGGRNSMAAADDGGHGRLSFLAFWRCFGSVEASRASGECAARPCQARGDVGLLQLARYTANQGCDGRRDSAAPGLARFWVALCRTARGVEQDEGRRGRTGLKLGFYRRGRRGCPWRARRGWRRRPGLCSGLASVLAGRVGFRQIRIR
jgi:hypothetical protein